MTRLEEMSKKAPPVSPSVEWETHLSGVFANKTVDGIKKSGINSPVEVKVVKIPLFPYYLQGFRVLAPSQVVGNGISEPSAVFGSFIFSLLLLIIWCVFVKNLQDFCFQSSSQHNMGCWVNKLVDFCVHASFVKEPLYLNVHHDS